MKYVIGLDGGGTKMAVRMCDTEGNFVRSAKFGPSNVHDLGVEAFGREMEKLPEALGIEDVNDVAAVFGGLAGGTGYRHAVNAKLEAIFPQARVRNGSDAENILFAGLGVEDGCGLISGTGSILYARRKGELHRIGGWGWLFDCAGSGYDLGRDAVLACLREYDGRDGHTLLSDLFAEKFGCGVRQHLDEIYIRGKTYVASFAPLVFEAYRRGDAAAAAIMEKSADALAELITSAARFFDGEYRVTMAGSIMTKEPELCDLVKERAPKAAKLTVLEREPVEGAVEAARWLLTLDALPPLAEE